MKKILLSIVLCLMLFIVPGCTKKVQDPNLVQIRAISDLATLKLHYHNVAKSFKTKGDGILHLGEKDREYWLEYTGVARVGIDTSKVNMKLNGEKVIVSIPKAKVLSITEHPSEYKIIKSDDGWNKNKITADDQKDAVTKAQNKMKETIEGNEQLLFQAEERAKTLIENYIKQLGSATDINYKIEWEYIEE